MSKPSAKMSDEAEDATNTSSMHQRKETIRAGVLEALGRPVELLRVAVMPLWGDNYRVNVIVGHDATGVLIPNSFFLTADDNGTILKSRPPILKQY